MRSRHPSELDRKRDPTKHRQWVHVDIRLEPQAEGRCLQIRLRNDGQPDSVAVSSVIDTYEASKAEFLDKTDRLGFAA